MAFAAYLLRGPTADDGPRPWGPGLARNGDVGDVIDPAAGWGDRLGAAFLTGARSYRGWDTNPELQDVYWRLAARYAAALGGAATNWSVAAAPFEATPDAEIANSCDTVITSPPFYDKEIYEGDATSTAVYRTADDWYAKYYRVMWRKAALALRPGGRVIAYIPPGRMYGELFAVMDEAAFEYVGAVGFSQRADGASAAGAVRDAFIWRRPRGHGGGAAAATRRYAAITGEVASAERDAIVAAFNAPANARGDVIKAILVSKAGAEGLDLKHLRETHQVESYWDRARDDQVKARAIRLGSLDAIPREERTVQPYLYLAVANRKVRAALPEPYRETATIDEEFHAKATERHEINQSFNQLLASVSIECSLVGRADCHTCMPTDVALFRGDAAGDPRTPDPCVSLRKTEMRATRLEHGGRTYYYVEDASAPYGYRFYVYDAGVGGNVPVGAGDPVRKVLAGLAGGLTDG